ncbi:hypothetical protein DFH09DRAFT_1008192, partial [Mycena vulgaris]
MPATSAAVLEQILPLLALILLPALALRLFTFVRPRIHASSMALGALLPWNWGYSTHEKEREHGKKRRVRTRAEQLSEKNKPGNEKGLALDAAAADPADADDAHFPGLVNMSGTHCFMNSTLQAMASLSSLPPYLLAIRTRAETHDVPTPVVDALLDLLAALNSPDPAAARPLRATALVEALCAPPPALEPPPPGTGAASALAAFWDARGSGTAGSTSAKAAALLASHEHQDAQEFFQLLSECVREEGARVAREGGRDRGFALGLGGNRGFVLGGGEEEEEALAAPSPFDGLTATRRACVRCGYTAAIRHFAFDSVQLALESAGGGWGGTTLPTLLRAYTALEVLHDCPCRRCALRATARRLTEEAARLADGAEEKPPSPTPSRVRRLKAVRRMEARVLRALEAGRIEEEELEGEWDEKGVGDALKGVRIERVVGGVCTRQSMLGRPPAILALHINRSVHTGMRVAKNGSRVAFPELLDLAPYTTDGVLSLEPTAALSGADAGGAEVECLYRLAAVVCHYGQHSFGHYICYRRAPVPSAPTSSAAAYAPALPTRAGSEGTGTGWLRISDARVDRCGVEAVLAEGSAAFMLYYERVLPPPVYAGALVAVEADSAETLRP